MDMDGVISESEHEFDSGGNTVTHRLNKGWPDDAHYQPSNRSKGVGLKDQSRDLQLVIHDGIMQVQGNALFVTAYPSSDSTP